MPLPAQPAPATPPTHDPALERLELLYRLCRSASLLGEVGVPGQLEAKLTLRQVQDLFSTGDLAERYPPIMTYAQAADLVQVAVDTLKGLFSQGKYANCVKRGKPGLVVRDLFVQQVLRDRFGKNLD